MTSAVEVRTGARLHFGLLSTGGPGRLGGIGMMIDRPGFLLRARKAEVDFVAGPPEAAARILEFLSRVREGLRREPDAAARRFEIEIVEAMPFHRGYGAGTQLAFAVAAVATRSIRAATFNPMEQLGRGGRSQVGSWGFLEGGFTVDAGDSCRERLGVVTRGGDILGGDVPAAWRVVIVDPDSPAGPSGTNERETFRNLAPMPPATSDRLCRLVRDSVLPGLKESRFLDFAAGVAAFNRIVGEHFAPVQGGVYAHPLIRGLAGTLAGTDWPHLAQSSWGPAAAVFCESAESAEALRAFLAERVSPHEAEVLVASPRNTGAEVRKVV